MPFAKSILAILCAALIGGCGSGPATRKIDIGNVKSVKSSFGPDFKVVTAGPTGIDPKLLAPQSLPGRDFRSGRLREVRIWADAAARPEGQHGRRGGRG